MRTQERTKPIGDLFWKEHEQEKGCRIEYIALLNTFVCRTHNVSDEVSDIEKRCGMVNENRNTIGDKERVKIPLSFLYFRLSKKPFNILRIGRG